MGFAGECATLRFLVFFSLIGRPVLRRGLFSTVVATAVAISTQAGGPASCWVGAAADAGVETDISDIIASAPAAIALTML